MTNEDKPGWYSISVEYESILSELRPGRGEWYLHATLIHDYRDLSGTIQTEKTPLGSMQIIGGGGQKWNDMSFHQTRRAAI